MSEEELAAGCFPGNPARQGWGEVSGIFLVVGKRAFQDQKICLPAEVDDIRAVFRVPGINQGPAFKLHAKANAGLRVGHG